MNDGSKEILYHYCSTEAFHSIVTTHSIRLSDLWLSNDSMEGKMVTEALVRLAKRDKCDPVTILLLQHSLMYGAKNLMGLDFACLNGETNLASGEDMQTMQLALPLDFHESILNGFEKSIANQKVPFRYLLLQK
jgi:hypothetical protein